MSTSIHYSFDKITINLDILKKLKLFYFCDPKSYGIFNYNSYHLIVTLYTIVIQCLDAYKSFGLTKVRIFIITGLKSNIDRILLNFCTVINLTYFICLMLIIANLCK